MQVWWKSQLYVLGASPHLRLWNDDSQPFPSFTSTQHLLLRNMMKATRTSKAELAEASWTVPTLEEAFRLAENFNGCPHGISAANVSPCPFTYQYPTASTAKGGREYPT